MSSIRTNIIAVVVLVSLIVAFLLTGYGFIEARYDNMNNHTVYIETLTEELTLVVSEFMNYHKGYLVGQSQALLVEGDYSQAYLAEFTPVMAEGNPYIIYSYFNTPTDQGHFTSSDGWIPPEDYTWQNKYWVDKVAASDEVFIDFPSLDSVTGEMVAVLRLRVYDGQLHGMLNMAIGLKELSTSVALFDLPGDGYAFITDGEDRIVAYPDEDIFTGKEEPVITDINPGFDTSLSTFDFEGFRYVARPVQGTDWTVWTGTPIAYFYEGSRELLVRYSLIFLGALAISILIAYFLGKRISKPIVELKDVAQSIAEGDYEVGIHDKFSGLKNEIGDLSRVFEKMIERVKDRTDRLSEMNRELEYSYQETQALNEEMAAAEEALQLSYNELTQYKEKLEYVAYHDTKLDVLNREKLTLDIRQIIHVNRNMSEQFGRLMYVTFREVDYYKYNLSDKLFHQFVENFGKLLLEGYEDKVNQYYVAPGIFAMLWIDSEVQQIDQWKEQVEHKVAGQLALSNDRIQMSLIFSQVDINEVIATQGGRIISPSTVMSFAMNGVVKGMEQKRGNAYISFGKDSYEDIQYRSYIESNLYKAINNNGFHMVLQPKYDVFDHVIGAEALVRWVDETYGFIPPSDFIPIAENIGLIEKIDLAVLNQVLKVQKDRLEEAKEIVPISVNLSLVSLLNQQMIDDITDCVKMSGVDSHLIDFEITETAFAADLSIAKGHVNQLREKGFKIHLDDYGTGYSSMRYLIEFHVDVIKMDKVFVDAVLESVQSKFIIQGAIEMARVMGMEFIAEGVENKEQVDVLKSIGCYHFQGYYFSKPLSVEDYFKLLDEELVTT